MVTTGIALKLALSAAEKLSLGGIEAAVLHLPTVKPLDVTLILEMASQTKAIVTIEEHTILGGLGGAIAEIIAEARFDKPIRFKRIGVKDVFPDIYGYGTQERLMAENGISEGAIETAVKELLT